MSRCIMGLTTQDPYILKEHMELYKILKFRVNRSFSLSRNKKNKLKTIQWKSYEIGML